MRSILLFLLACPLLALSQSITSDFENIQVNPNSYIKDAGPDRYFEDAYVRLPNEYTDAGSFDFWNGWVVSNVKDTITEGFVNEGASYAGEGVNGSDNYAVSYVPSPTRIHLTEEARSKAARFESLYISNNTYAALSMKNGDAFAKKFGGVSGDDPDFFMLTISAWLDGEIKPVALDIFLADYRFEDNSEDYILKDWQWVDLTSLGQADSLEFSLSSSDNGSFGMNTPAYFCIDNVTVQMPNSTEEINSEDMFIAYPNPAQNEICFDNERPMTIAVYDELGRLQLKTNDHSGCLDISALRPGRYYIRNQHTVRGFIKI